MSPSAQESILSIAVAPGRRPGSTRSMAVGWRFLIVTRMGISTSTLSMPPAGKRQGPGRSMPCIETTGTGASAMSPPAQGQEIRAGAAGRRLQTLTMMACSISMSPIVGPMFFTAIQAVAASSALNSQVRRFLPGAPVPASQILMQMAWSIFTWPITSVSTNQRPGVIVSTRDCPFFADRGEWSRRLMFS